MQLKAQTADARLRVGIPDNRIVHKSKRKKYILESITYMYIYIRRVHMYTFL